MSSALIAVNLEECFVKTFLLDLPTTATFVYKSYNNCLQADFGPCIYKYDAFEMAWTSQDVVVVGDIASKRYVLFGAVTAFRSFTHFIVHKEQSRLASVNTYQPAIKRGEVPEEIVVLNGNDWRELLIEYAQIAAKRMGARVGDTALNCIGYCSWYYYYHKVTQRQFIESVEAMASKRTFFPAQYAQIDDGYQISHGDWLEQNEDWPTPLKDTVKTINDLGMQAGIWTMPFLASKASNVFKSHPDWFVRDRHGKPWYINGWSPAPNHEWACLDVSRSDVQRHLLSIYETLYDWGFRYFKFDGGGFSAPQGIRFDADATGVSCLRDGFKIIRKAVKESLMLGCGMPFLASLGLVDNNRVSMDTGKTWVAYGLPTVAGQAIDRSQPCTPSVPSLKNALHGTLCRWWQYDRWFRADPDVVMARDENTELTLGEARLSVLSAIVTGVAFTSDRLDQVGGDRLRLYSMAAKLRIRDIKPLDWENNSYCYIFEGTLEQSKAVAVLNYSECPINLKLFQLGTTTKCKELLHALGKLEDSIQILPHDGALIVEQKYSTDLNI